MAAAVFTKQTVQVPASAYLGLSASSAVATPTLYTAGAVEFWVYTPDAIALAAFGLTNQKIPLMVVFGSLSSVLTGVGVNEGADMVEAGVLARKLGFGANRDGSAQVPITSWPMIVAFIQGPNSWTPHISGESTRGWWMIHDAVVAYMLANYNIDPGSIHATGISGGGGTLMEYVMGNVFWPTRFTTRYASVTTICGSFSGSGTRQDWPEAIPGETSTTQTFPRLARFGMLASKIPWWEVHSFNDASSTPSIYNLWGDAFKQYAPNVGNPIPAGGLSAGTLRYHGKTMRFLEYTGGTSPIHSAVPDTFYGNNAAGGNGPLVATDSWPTWVLQQRIPYPSQRTATNKIYTYAGGSNGPATARVIRGGFVGPGVRA